MQKYSELASRAIATVEAIVEEAQKDCYQVLTDPGLNLNHHVQLTLTVQEVRQLSAWAKAGGRKPKPSNKASDKHIALQGCVLPMGRLLKSVEGLMRIVEGVMNKRWAHEGRRLVDTTEWCELYCAWKDWKRQDEKNAKAELAAFVKRLRKNRQNEKIQP